MRLSAQAERRICEKDIVIRSIWTPVSRREAIDLDIDGSPDQFTLTTFDAVLGRIDRIAYEVDPTLNGPETIDTRTYDAAGLLATTSIEAFFLGGSSLSRTEYLYDADGRVSEVFTDSGSGVDRTRVSWTCPP